ncbi:MAG: hypothetical protein PHO10_06795 [Gemmiger sp.]|nr:hypothetical protein [Gemmiger sp.]
MEEQSIHNTRSAPPAATGKKRAGALWPLLLSYLASLLLMVLAVVAVAMFTLCSKGYLQRQVKKSSFTNAVYALLCDNYESYGAATGFSAEVMTSFISTEKIAADMDKSVSDLYDGDTAFDLRNEISNACYDALKADVQGRGLEITEDVKSGIAVVADACRQDYANYVGVPLASQFYTIVTKLNRVLWVGLAISALFAGAALLLAARLSGSPRAGLRCFIFAFTAAAGLCLLLAVGVYPSLRLASLSIQPASLRLLLLSYVKDVFGSFGIFAAVYGLLAAGLLATTLLAHSLAARRLHRRTNRN